LPFSRVLDPGRADLAVCEGQMTSSEMLFPLMIAILCAIGAGILGGIAITYVILKRLFNW
jgi:hypothetical protein